MPRHIKPLRTFARDKRGTITMNFAMMAVPVFAIAGAAIDVGRAVSMRTKLQGALDLAIVSGVATLQESSDNARAQEATENLFRSHFPAAQALVNGQPPVGGTAAETTFSISISGSNVSGTAASTVPTPFLALIMGSSLEVTAQSSGVPPSGKKIEIGMMIDVTGSMGAYRNGETKIAGLKTASADLLDILLPDSGVNDDSVRIGIAPFADYVNAGEFASKVTGLAEIGPYDNLTNLKSTRQTTFRGNYSGIAGNTPGSQAGASSASGLLNAGGQSAPTSPGGAGATYSAGHCTNPTITTTIAIHTYSGYRTGIEIDREDGMDDPVTGLIYVSSGAPSSQRFARIYDVDGEGNNWVDYYSYAETGYFAPRPSSQVGLTRQERTATWNGNSRTGSVGALVPFESSFNEANILSMGFVKATSQNGYWRLKKLKNNGNHEYEWKTSGFYLPLFTSLTTTTTDPNCTSTSQPQGKLVTCVTERSGSQAYTDATPAAGQYVGAFNHGNTATRNYSEDGKCWVAGRELPKVIPLTNDKQVLADFFTNATVGGATPGHIGTAWAWGLISPNWSSVWGLAEPATPYNDPNVIKAAILMTDGEYNIHYQTPSAREQALAICSNMRAAGVKIYTIGFGFSASSTRDDNSTEGKAKDLLMQCAGEIEGTYFFPYDSAALKQDFQAIANQLVTSARGGKARLTN